MYKHTNASNASSTKSVCVSTYTEPSPPAMRSWGSAQLLGGSAPQCERIFARQAPGESSRHECAGGRALEVSAQRKNKWKSGKKKIKERP